MRVEANESQLGLAKQHEEASVATGGARSFVIEKRGDYEARPIQGRRKLSSPLSPHIGSDAAEPLSRSRVFFGIGSTAGYVLGNHAIRGGSHRCCGRIVCCVGRTLQAALRCAVCRFQLICWVAKCRKWGTRIYEPDPRRSTSSFLSIFALAFHAVAIFATGRKCSRSEPR